MFYVYDVYIPTQAAHPVTQRPSSMRDEEDTDAYSDTKLIDLTDDTYIIVYSCYDLSEEDDGYGWPGSNEAV